ncbi:MAG: hypothetical protein IIB82_12905 [Bacteroidetes bacterium]|nr:hypothetical protein [Bacteroidota bacterium]
MRHFFLATIYKIFITGTKTLKVDFSGVLWGVNFRQGFISTWMGAGDPEADGKPPCHPAT